MKNYECMYILKPLEGDDVINEVKYIENIINTNKGMVQKSDIWGKKSLAYTINDCKEGVYVLVTFDGIPECIKELDRVLRIKDNVLRHMIISKGC